MSRPRRMHRHPDHGPNRHRVRVSVRLKRLSERMRDLIIEQSPDQWLPELRGQGAQP